MFVNLLKLPVIRVNLWKANDHIKTHFPNKTNKVFIFTFLIIVNYRDIPILFSKKQTNMKMEKYALI